MTCSWEDLENEEYMYRKPITAVTIITMVKKVMLLLNVTSPLKLLTLEKIIINKYINVVITHIRMHLISFLSIVNLAAKGLFSL